MLSQRKSLLFALGALSALLAGCGPTLTQPTQSTQTLSKTPAQYISMQDQSKVHTKIVHEYVPVPIPGQLMPKPNKANTHMPVFYSKAKAVDYANQHALVDAKSSDFFNSMMTYNYMPGAMYVIYAAPLHITDVMFAPGEKIISEAAGDTLRWQIAQTYSGQGDTLRQHLLIKPNQAGLSNSMVVTTNHHVYHIVLKSTQHTYMVAVQWQYPSNMIQISNQPQDSSGSSASTTAGYQIDLNKVDFSYKFGMVQGSRPTWYPVRVFNDGRQTFIEFPKNFYNDNTPILYVADNDGKYGTMVNWRLKGRYMIIDQVIKKARLETGVAKTGKTIVQIEQS